MASNLNFVSGLCSGIYLHDTNHALLASDAWKQQGPNIGACGENLTISFLSMNRASLSEKLLSSIADKIPNFAGEILIVDNGSNVNELEHLRLICAKSPYRSRIIELGKNYGVAGGRNRTIPHVATDWLMCLDNDIYFIENPLPQIQRDLARLGCHFISLPLLDPDGHTVFARGGHLYVSYEEGELHIGAGSACKQEAITSLNGEAFLSTFLFGGACVFNKNTFEYTGGYDEAMFVGFEDIDLSIRLFQSGFKVGSTAICALIHDHPKPASDSDRDYERERFSRQVLHDSARHLENKHGFKIWSDAVDSWLATRHDELGLVHHRVEKAEQLYDLSDLAPSVPHKKPRIALIIDTDNWAFGNISRQIQRYLSDQFEFTVIPMDVIDNIDHILLLTRDCDLVHFFWREHLRLIGTPYYRSYVEELGCSYEEFDRRFVKTKKITTSIYDHLLLEPDELAERANIYNRLIAGYTVGSNKLRDIYLKAPDYPPPFLVAEDGVDLTIFKPKRLERFTELPERDLVIGWVGNSQWAAELEDFKGVNTLLKPAIEQLRAEGVRLHPFFADRQERFIPHAEMPDYYAQIDVYVCTSRIEGTPNPVLESMACGVPIITTDVGIVPQAFGELQRKFILNDRTVDNLKEKIREIYNSPNVLTQLSQENLHKISEWDWSIKANNFGIFFAAALCKSR